MHLRTLVTLVAAGLAGGLLPSGLQGQAPDDVELLGQIHGTRPPEAYYRFKREHPGAFRFNRGWMARNPHLRAAAPGAGDGAPRWEMRPLERGATVGRNGAPVGGGGAVEGASGAMAYATLGPRGGAVQGTFRVPLVLGLFSDSPAQGPYSRSEIQREFFDGPNSRYRTITEFYDEISGGRVNLLGETREWARSTLTAAEVAGGASGLTPAGRVGEYIVQLLVRVDDGTVDWGRYDNDGPDGVPNSGDDDGFVDILTVMHPLIGAECGDDQTGAYKPTEANRVWSHKYDLESWMGRDNYYTTKSPAAGGGFVKVSDYTIQPALSCNFSQPTINEIGVLAHELGHGFGLPDLYVTSNNAYAGIGRWGLMGSGSWGCSFHEPQRPCHMSAWSKAMLGWAEVQTLAPETDLGTLSLDPVVTGGPVYRIDAGDGTNDYFLLENRQPAGFDANLATGGLLIWRIDEDKVLGGWSSNTVNGDRRRLGVWLQQADGLGHLTAFKGGRGDAGDPFPGSTGNRVFHAASNPAATTHLERPSGLTLLDITEAGGRMGFRALTRFQDVTVEVDGEPGGENLFTVDGTTVGGSAHTFRSAPFQSHVVRAAAGRTVTDGVREAFAGWLDDPALPAERTFVTGLTDTVLHAGYGGRQVRLRVGVEGARFGVVPGTVGLTPATPQEGQDFWVHAGTDVTLRADPTDGFAFVEWMGVTAGQGNPATLTLGEPRDVTAVFTMTYGVPETTEARIEAARPQEIVLQTEHGMDPVTFTLTSGALPDGLTLGSSGRITGSPLVTGTFDATIEAVEGRGLRSTGALRLVVDAPRIPVSALASPFLLQGPSLDGTERLFLDRAGNHDGAYDLGDLRAFLLANPDLPMTAQERGLVRTLLPMFQFVPGGDR